MPRSSTPFPLSLADARRLWLRAQRLDVAEPFGSGPEAVRRATEHLGYVQIDTINVIERSHHHILFTRIPSYRRADLHHAQSVDKSVFEYWTHALAYVPTADFRFFMPAMRKQRDQPVRWFGTVTPDDLRKVMTLLRTNGPLTIRDIDDDVLVEKNHPWASRKPSKRALQVAFFIGDVTVSERTGMLKTYDLTERHFGWTRRPRPATPAQIAEYRLDRALRAGGVIKLESASRGAAGEKAAIRDLIDRRVRRGTLMPVALEGAGKTGYWAAPEALAAIPPPGSAVHILSPFDPLIIQRQRLKLFFGYEHRFEAYLPKEKRIFGYFGLPVLVGEEIAAVLDLKTDREHGKLLVQQWHWVGNGTPAGHQRPIEEALHRFEAFQVGD